MIRTQTSTSFNKSVVNRADKGRLIEEIAALIVHHGISLETFQTYDPSYSKYVYYDLRRRAEEVFSAKRLDSILSTIVQQSVAA